MELRLSVACFVVTAGRKLAEYPEIVHEAAGEEIRAVVVGRVDEGHPEIGPEEDVGAMKRCGGDADYGERMLVDVDRRTDDCGIGGEAAAPEVVAQDDVWRRLGTVLVGGVEESS